MASCNFPWAWEKPHDGVGLDGSFRVWHGQGGIRPIITDAEIAETAGGPREHQFPVLTDEVRQACQSIYPN
jgi:hypothetical protein